MDAEEGKADEAIDQVMFKKRMVFCYQNCFDLLWEKIVLVFEKNFWNLRLKKILVINFKYILLSLNVSLKSKMLKDVFAKPSGKHIATHFFFVFGVRDFKFAILKFFLTV